MYPSVPAIRSPAPRPFKETSFPPHEWAHLAAAYEQSWAVELSDGAYLEAPDNDALDIADDLTVEVFCRVDALDTAQGLLSKGRAADGSGGSVPYRLLVLPDGKLEFGFEEPDGKLVRFTSTEAVGTGRFHRLAVVRKSGRSMQERKGSKEITAAGADGKPVKQTVELVESVDVQEWQDIRFFIDGREAGSARYEGPGAKGNSGTLDIGRVREGMETRSLTGVVAEVRLWGLARDAAQLGTPVTARDRGLTAQWRFEENAGNTAADTTGSHPARLRERAGPAIPTRAAAPSASTATASRWPATPWTRRTSPTTATPSSPSAHGSRGTMSPRRSRASWRRCGSGAPPAPRSRCWTTSSPGSGARRRT
ncbi:hypothetical protein B1H19_02940 [Streptomyces gilvosporeus]|uniref:LamG-like jellyroll fold domain-containing protein n=1 Tax=Streptomyces gilvosporeus TaxID=553510 RepID=A0A1V0TJY5_9ACTN|nr:LamG domain-containing protein [Streptomyces gilvosporeus]ARF53257.1 hypothetical protein B1H19_02940 [Streptomyces gilvosporeus]